MRILFVAPMQSIHSVRWVTFFARAGHDVHVIDASFGGDHEVSGVTVHHIPLRGTRLPVLKYLFRFPRWIARWRRLVGEIRPELMHIHWLGLHALGAALSGFKPLVVTPWGSDLLLIPQQSAKRRLLLKCILAAGSVFICCAFHLREALVRRGVPKECIHVFGFGTDVAKYAPSRSDPHLPRELDFDDYSPLIISLRALYPVYDVGTLIGAIPAVLAACPAARFVIVGEGPERTGLQQHADELGVSNVVRFVGRLSGDDIVRYTASSKVYVSTALSDGFSASLSEAMACGVPPVVTDFGDNPLWVEDGVSGFLFPGRDATCLAKRIIELLSDCARARQIGGEARHTIVVRNNVDIEMTNVEQLYRAMIRGKHRTDLP